MSTLQLVITDAGYAALVNAELLGTDAIQIAEVGLTPDSFLAAASLTALPGEARRLTTIAGEPTGEHTINLVIRDDDEDIYSVRGFGLFLADGILFATYSSDDLIVEKSGLASILITVDLAFGDIDTALIEFGDMSWTNPQATTTRKGVSELATSAEAITGTDEERTITPAALKAALLALVDGTVQPGLDLKADKVRTITGAGLVSGGGDLTANRTLTVTECSAAEALAGVAADKVVTPRRLKAAIDALIGGAPGALDTLDELAAALADDASFAATMTTQLGLKASIAYVDAQLALKSTIVYVDTQLAAARTQILTERAGTFVWVGYDSAGLDPATMVLANGGLANRVTDARLFAKFGTTFGVGDGATTFGLPEVRGEFFRALDIGRGIDVDRVLGSAQADDFKSHTHSVAPPAATDDTASGQTSTGTGGVETINPYNTGSAGGAETRPRNVAFPVAIWR